MPTVIEVATAAGVVESIDADAVTRESYSYPAEVTAAPVERGVEIVDHLRPGPISAELELVFTEDPLEIPSFGAGGAAFLPGAERVLAEPLQRASAVVDRLRRSQERGELCAIVSARRGRVERLACTGVSEPYEAPRGVTIGVSLRQVRIAEIRTVAVPAALLDRGRRNRGRQPARRVEPARARSLLSKISGYGKAVD